MWKHCEPLCTNYLVCSLLSLGFLGGFFQSGIKRSENARGGNVAPGSEEGQVQCPGTGTGATALTRVWEGQCPRSGCAARAGEQVCAEPAWV